MSATDIQTNEFSGRNLPLAAVAVNQGEIACINTAGYLTKGAATATLIAIGIIGRSVDNSAGAAGDKTAPVQFSASPKGRRTFYVANNGTDACDQTSVGHDVYVAGANAVRKTSDSGACPRAGKCWGFHRDGRVEVEFDVDPDAVDIAGLDDRVTDLETAVAAGMQVQKKTVTVAYNNAALTATSGGSNGDSAAVNIGTALPSNARIVGVDMRSLTVFTGGSVSAVTCDVGVTGDVDALIDGADLQSAAVDGGPSTMPAGIRPNKTYASGGQLIATFTPDVGHKLSALTAGSVIIDVLYVELA